MRAIKAFLVIAISICVIASARSANAQAEDKSNRQETAQKQFDALLPCAAYYKIMYLCIPESMRDAKIAKNWKGMELAASMGLLWLADKASISLEFQARLLEEARARMFETIGNTCREKTKLSFAHDRKCIDVAERTIRQMIAELRAEDPVKAQTKKKESKKKKRNKQRSRAE